MLYHDFCVDRCKVYVFVVQSSFSEVSGATLVNKTQVFESHDTFFEIKRKEIEHLNMTTK